MKNSLADYAKFEEHLASLPKERRNSKRTDCSFEAVTQFNGFPKDSVYVTNISTDGLMMIVTPNTFIPKEFQLLGITDQPINCRMVWRKGEDVGVEFIADVSTSTNRAASNLN
jgi:hypothetical protein